MNVVLKKLMHMSQAVMDHLSGAEQPKIYGQPQSPLHRILAELPQLKQKYRPTPWLSNAHAHMLYFDIIKKRTIKLRYDAIEQLKMSDGGITAIAWFGKALAEDVPTILLLHTITGTPESMRELVRDLHRYTGWRIALCLRRGHAGLPMPVPKMNLFGSTQDLREQLLYIQDQFPTSDLYAVGSSAGTGLLVRYLGEEGEMTPFKAAFALCPGYNTESSFSRVHPVYSRFMAKKLLKRFILPYRETWQQLPKWHDILKIDNLSDFEKLYFELAGFKNYESYTQATNPIYVFENIKIPLMILNSEDDPICQIANFEPYKEAIQNMPNMMVITTKKGSHCGFYEGLGKTQSWATRLMADYLKQQADLSRSAA